MTPTRIDYLVSRFPRTSETFIAREIDALARAGAPVGVVRSLFGSPDTTVHPVAARWLGRAWRPAVHDVAAGVGWALRHHPARLGRVVAEVALDFRRAPGCCSGPWRPS